MNINKDLEKANEMMNSKYNHMFDKIYPFTTENHKYVLSDKDLTGKKCLSVLGSSSQVYSMFLDGCNDIDTFDINPLSIYNFYLIKSFIKSGISSKEYIDLFNSGKLYSDSIYKRLSDNMDSKFKLFWDTLYSKYGYNIFKTGKIFHNIERDKDNIIRHNPYLDNLDKLRDIDNLNIRFANKDICYLNTTNKYDLIYLSNIIQYCDSMFYDNEINSLKKFKDIINKLSDNLNNDGVMYCGYFYYFDSNDMCFKKKNVDKVFNSKEYSYESFPSFDDVCYRGNDGVLVYKKK